MSGGGDQPQQTQTTQQVLSQEQRELLELAMPGFREFAANPPARYQGSSVAAMDPSQIAGQEMALAGAGTQNQLGAAGANATNFLLNDVLNPDTNQYLRGTADAASRQIGQAFQEQVLPGVRGEAITAGGFGGTRQGIAEGLAGGRAAQAIGDSTTKIYSDAYGKGLDAQGRALALLPQTQNAQTTGAVTTSGVGDVRQQYAQSLLNDEIAGFNYDELLPFLMSSELASVLGGLPGGSTVSTGTTTGGSTGGARGALGGASMGASLGSAIMPGIGTAAGAGIGGLLGYFT